MATVRRSPTLAANERVQVKLAAGRPVIHLAFGEAGLPLHPHLERWLADGAAKHGYPPVAGTASLRAAAAGYFERRRLPTVPETVIIGPGSKPLLFALMLALDGDLVLPTPSWVSYEPQAQLAGKRVIRVAIPDEAGGVPDPDLLEDAIAAARSGGARPAIMLLTTPDNPTGTVASRSLLARVCAIARSEGLLVVSDEIYRDLAHVPSEFVSPAELYPEATVVTGGLSKSLSVGGWRLGFARMPQNEAGSELMARVADLASEIWSGVSAPVQEAAATALQEPAEIADYVARGRELHARVARALHAVVVEQAGRCRAPQGGFYLYPELSAPAFTSATSLAEFLLDRHDIAVLPGEAFGDDEARLRFRLASSLLYGANDDQRWQALSAAEPEKLPWIASALERVGAALADARRNRS
ncbi:MAG TPA: pyridoxal phosphate-dependent aminotransferase [Candidatus Dormibacteraeota bacterium]